MGMCALLLACSSESEGTEPGPTPVGEWVGVLADGETWIAVSSDEQSVVAYVCGGDNTLATHTRWFVTPSGGSDLAFDHDGWRLETSLSDGDISGSLIDPDGLESSFAANHTAEGDPAGLFTAFDSGCRDGVIVESGGSSQGAWCDLLDNFGEVTPAMPIDASGFDVVAATPMGDRMFFVEPLVPGQTQLE